MTTSEVALPMAGRPSSADADADALSTLVPVCSVSRFTPDRGLAALVEGTAVAVFALADGTWHAIDNVDPVSGASVLSRGIVGDVDGASTVASPMYKQRFVLATGECLDADVRVRVHDVRATDGIVHVRLARR